MNVKKIIKRNFGGGGRLTRISPIRLRLEYVISRLSKFLDAFITPSHPFVNTKKRIRLWLTLFSCIGEHIYRRNMFSSFSGKLNAVPPLSYSSISPVHRRLFCDLYSIHTPYYIPRAFLHSSRPTLLRVVSSPLFVSL